MAVTSDRPRRVSPGDTPIARTLVRPGFQAAAAYLLTDPLRLPPGIGPGDGTETAFGSLLTHPQDNGVGASIRQTGTWEPGLGRFLGQALRPGMNAIDIGAHIGYFTLLMARAAGDTGRILAIEPDSENFPILRANVERNRLANVELLPVAASDGPGLVVISHDPRNQGASTGVRSMAGWTSTPAQAVALDDLLDPETPVDLVKIDAEGMDHLAVRGLRDTIARWRPLISVEFNPGWINALGEEPECILRFYRELGYTVDVLGGEILRWRVEAGMCFDALLLNNLRVMPDLDHELTERARAMHWVDLVLAPIAAREF